MCESECGDQLHRVEPGERVRHLQQGGQLRQQARPHHPVQVLLTGKKEKDFNILQCSGSGMFIPDPDFYPSRIPDPGSWISDPGSKDSNKREGWKKLVVIPFYVATNFTKLKIILCLNCWRKKIWANFQRIIELLMQKIVIKLSKIWFWDPGSSGQKGIGSRIPDPGPQHCV